MTSIAPPVKNPLFVNWYFIVEADKDYPHDKIKKYLYKCIIHHLTYLHSHSYRYHCN